MSPKSRRRRYTPKKKRGPAGTETPYRSAEAMRPLSARVGASDPTSRLAAHQEFLRGTILPRGLALLRPIGGDASPAVAASLPPMLVMLVDPQDIDADMRAVLDARAAEQDRVAWGSSVRGQVGWTTLASISGGPVADAEASFAKLNFDLTAPMRYKASFLFHLAQSRSHVEAVASGGLFAFAVPELVQQLVDLSFADAMDSLPYFSLPAAPQLASFLERLRPGPSEEA